MQGKDEIPVGGVKHQSSTMKRAREDAKRLLCEADAANKTYYDESYDVRIGRLRLKDCTVTFAEMTEKDEAAQETKS